MYNRMSQIYNRRVLERRRENTRQLRWRINLKLARSLIIWRYIVVFTHAIEEAETKILDTCTI